MVAKQNLVYELLTFENCVFCQHKHCCLRNASSPDLFPLHCRRIVCRATCKCDTPGIVTKIWEFASEGTPRRAVNACSCCRVIVCFVFLLLKVLELRRPCCTPGGIWEEEEEEVVRYRRGNGADTSCLWCYQWWGTAAGTVSSPGLILLP